MSSIYNWSKTAAANATADGDINWQEGMAPSSVNNSAREMMARIAELLGDLGGALTAGGTADALTLTASSSFTTYADGLRISFRVASDNTGAATLNVNAIGAKALRYMASGGDAALADGMLKEGGIYVAIYSTDANSGVGGWIVLNPTMDAQPLDATLTALAAVTFAADEMLYATGDDTFDTTPLTEFARSVLDDDDAATARTTLGAASSSTTVTGSGLASGGGALSTNRTITVTEASEAEAKAGTASDVVITPRRMLAVGLGQTWQNVTASRAAGTGYQNATGKPIMVCIQFNAGIADPVQVSTNGSSWVTIFNGSSADASLPYSFIVPSGHYYRINGTVSSLESWAELR